MAKGYWRRTRYIARYADGTRIPAASANKIRFLINAAKGTTNPVTYIETETGDVPADKFFEKN